MPKLRAERRPACRHGVRTRRDQAAYTGAVGREAAARGGAWARRDAERLPRGAPARVRGAAARAARARPRAPERSAAPVPCQRVRVARETQPARPHWRGRQAGRSLRCRKGPEMGRPPPRGQGEGPPLTLIDALRYSYGRTLGCNWKHPRVQRHGGALVLGDFLQDKMWRLFSRFLRADLLLTLSFCDLKFACFNDYLYTVKICQARLASCFFDLFLLPVTSC